MKKNKTLSVANEVFKQDFVNLEGFQIGYCTKQGKGKSQNDDALTIHLVDNKTAIFAVADGVGSAKNARFASQSALKRIVTRIKKRKGVKNLAIIRHDIIDCIFEINHEFSSKKGYLTTLTVCVIHDAMVQVFQVGDSGLQLFGQRGKLRYKTTSHSPVGYAQKAGVLDNAGAIEHPDNHYIDNLIGDGLMHVEISSPFALSKLDTILLASDGLYDNILLEDLINFIRCGKAEEITYELGQCVKKQINPKTGQNFIKEDDISFIIIRLNACLFES